MSYSCVTFIYLKMRRGGCLNKGFFESVNSSNLCIFGLYIILLEYSYRPILLAFFSKIGCLISERSKRTTLAKNGNKLNGWRTNKESVI